MRLASCFRCLFLLAVLTARLACADGATPAMGLGMEGFAYPYPVRVLELTMEGQPVRMSYMDVNPDAGRWNGRTVVLMHGRNFFGAYWAGTIEVLRDHGFRVVVPDQIGFGKSSKPDVPHSFHSHARNTQALLAELGVAKADFVGHSIGGMLAVRFALMYPDAVDHLVLEDPLGLEDYRLLVPYATREELTREQLAVSEESIERLFRNFVVEWRPEYQVFADVQIGWMRSPEAYRAARTAAQTYTMAYEQPVVYELPLLHSPTLLVAGAEDRTALGRTRVSPEARSKMGRYTELAPRAAALIPHARLVMLEHVAHIPHLEAPERFHRALLEFLLPAP